MEGAGVVLFRIFLSCLWEGWDWGVGGAWHLLALLGGKGFGHTVPSTNAMLHAKAIYSVKTTFRTRISLSVVLNARACRGRSMAATG